MTDKNKVIIAMTTCPAAPIANRIAEALVGEGFAACVNQITGVTSTYYMAGTGTDRFRNAADDQNDRKRIRSSKDPANCPASLPTSRIDSDPSVRWC
jgi:hypothetical protein